MADAISQESERARESKWLRAASALDVFQLLLLVLAFAGGAFVRQQLPGDTWPAGWTTLFVALGTLCLGFGAATLIYQRRQQDDAATLRIEFDVLEKRAEALADEMNRLGKSKGRSGDKSGPI